MLPSNPGPYPTLWQSIPLKSGFSSFSKTKGMSVRPKRHCKYKNVHFKFNAWTLNNNNNNNNPLQRLAVSNSATKKLNMSRSEIHPKIALKSDRCFQKCVKMHPFSKQKRCTILFCTTGHHNITLQIYKILICEYHSTIYAIYHLTIYNFICYNCCSYTITVYYY